MEKGIRGIDRMDFQQIKLFLSVARHLNFTRAAEEFYTTQPTVSRQIHFLEEEWGFPLFVRNKKEVRLTPEGAIMLGKCQQMEKLMQEGLSEVQEMKSGQKGELRVGCLEAMDTDMFVSPAAAFFCKKYPHIRINLEKRSFAELRKKLEEGAYDVIYTLDFELQNMQDVQYESCYPVKAAFVLSRSHPMAQKEDLKLSDFNGQTFILPDPDDSPGRAEELRNILKKVGVTEYDIFYVPNQESMVLNTRASRGVAFLDTSVKNLFEEERFLYLTIGREKAYLNVICAWKAENSNPVLPLYISLLRENEFIDVFYN